MVVTKVIIFAEPPLSASRASWWLQEQTWTSGMQPFRKNSGIGVAETGESVTPGKGRKRKRWDSQRASSSPHHSGRDLAGSQAISCGLKRSMITARYVRAERSRSQNPANHATSPPFPPPSTTHSLPPDCDMIRVHAFFLLGASHSPSLRLPPPNSGAIQSDGPSRKGIQRTFCLLRVALYPR